MTPRRETRAEVGLVAPASRPRLPGPVRGCTAHWNGPAFRLAGQPHSACQAAWRVVQRFHMGRNHPDPLSTGRHWQDLAYTFAVCHHMIAMDGRGEGVRTAANGTNAGNNSWYACFFMVGAGEEPSREMLVAAEWYARTVLGVTIWNRHKDHKPTTCAGTVDKYVVDGRLVIEEIPEPTPTPQPAPRPTTWTERLVDNLPLVDRNRNSRGAWARRVQGLLVAAGVAPRNTIRSDGSLDGIFGPGTHDAVVTFQRRNGLSPDGVVGEKTWTKLLGR
jgi:peptidoglycan hydrolase-like protein with peptidoglycan-binding domain